MQKFKFVQQDPNVSSYKARISAEEWGLYENIIRDWHNMGKTRGETLSVLEKHFSFRPSLAQLNTQMTVWGLKTYKKDNNESQYEDQLKNRIYNNGLLQDGSPIHQFVLCSKENLRAIVKEYEIHLQSDTARFIHSLWKSISGEESIDAFLEKIRGFATPFLYPNTLEYDGDLLFGARALDDAFDMYNRSIHIRVHLKVIHQFGFALDEIPIRLIIKCAQSATSIEQKKVAAALLENCLLHQSITGELANTISLALRSCFTGQDPSQERHLEPYIGHRSAFEMYMFLKGMMSTLNVSHVAIICASTNAKEPGELCIPIQYAIYFHLWKGLFKPWSYGSVESITTVFKILAKFSHMLAQKLVDTCSETLLIKTRRSLPFEITEHFIWLVNTEAYTVEKLRCDLMDVHGSSSTLENLREPLKYGSIQAQCVEWLKSQVLEFIETRQRPTPRVYSPSRGSEKEVTGQTASQPDKVEAMDAEMTQSSHHDAPYSSTILARPPAIPQSLYLCSSSIRSSMLSMLSMASRIRRNARDSTFSILSKMSSNSRAMGMSGNFDFGQITGMGSDPVRPPSMDIVMVEEEAAPEKNP